MDLTNPDIFWLWWVIAAIVLGILEIFTVGFVVIMFAIGALAASAAAALGASLWIQVLVFSVVSGALLLTVRPWARATLEKTTPAVRTNAQGLVGATAVVRERVTNLDGRVLLEGEVWSARAEQNWEIPVGAHVRVLRITGATAIVGPLNRPVDPPADRT